MTREGSGGVNRGRGSRVNFSETPRDRPKLTFQPRKQKTRGRILMMNGEKGPTVVTVRPSNGGREERPRLDMEEGRGRRRRR